VARGVGLWDRRDAAAGSLSKGMRQKVALCRALLHDPELVFLDEPTSALDPEASGMVRELVADLRTQGRTVFLTTHHLEEADRLCDRIAVFRTRLRVLDTAANLRERLFGRQLTVTVARRWGRPRGPAPRRLPGVIELARDGDRLLMRVDDPDVVAPAGRSGARGRGRRRAAHLRGPPAARAGVPRAAGVSPGYS
jgi:ABC-2 type transport system ATP-binding protein